MHQPSQCSDRSLRQPVNASKPSRAYKPFTLPASVAGWYMLNRSENQDGLDINTLQHADSGSEIRLPQFVVLRAIWPNHRSSLMEFLEKLGFHRANYEKRDQDMMKNETWRAYINALRSNYKNPKSKPYTSSSEFPEEVGRFETALHNQLEIFEEVSRKNKQDTRRRVDIRASPVQLRPRALATALLTTPTWPLKFTNLDFESPATSSRSVAPRARDESIVNFALIAFLQAIWRLDPKHDTRWTAHRKYFKFMPAVPEGREGKGFKAIVDGHLI
jgi:hypothetical protein